MVQLTPPKFKNWNHMPTTRIYSVTDYFKFYRRSSKVHQAYNHHMIMQSSLFIIHTFTAIILKGLVKEFVMCSFA